MSPIRLFPLDGASRRAPEVEEWFTKPPQAVRREAQRWFEVMHSCGPDVTEVLHDGHPTACVAGIAMGYVNAFKDHANVGFYLRATLSDPDALLTGTGRFMRHVKVYPGKFVQEGALRDLIERAYADLIQVLAGATAQSRRRSSAP